MMKRLLAVIAAFLMFGGISLGATASDVTSSKNETLVKGASPHVRFVDDSGNDYTLTVNGDVMRVENLDANTFFSVPATGTIGIELDPPSSLVAVPAAGGSLAPNTTYFFVVTALTGFGETIASPEASCTTTLTDLTCNVSWPPSAPPAQDYLVFQSLNSGQYTAEDATGGATFFSATTFPRSNAHSPPDVSTAYSITFQSDGIHFADGSIQSTASGNGAWQTNGLNILNANTGNVGISLGGGVFTPDALLTVLGVIDVNDMGALKALATNNMQMRSNYRNSTDRLWNTAQSSWAVVAGDSADDFAVFRAPSTVGAPSYAQLLLLDGATRNFNLNIGPSFANRVNIDPNGVFLLSGNTATDTFTVGVGSQPFFRLDTSTETFEFVIVNANDDFVNFSGTNVTFTDFTNDVFQVRNTAAASSTNLSLLRNGSTSLSTVSVGAVDSCGVGFRCLRVPN